MHKLWDTDMMERVSRRKKFWFGKHSIAMRPMNSRRARTKGDASGRYMRQGLALLFLLVASRYLLAGEQFAPEEWLRLRHLGKLTSITPQSGRPIQRIAARSLDQWQKERQGYLRAYIELVGAWPALRPPLCPTILEEKAFAKWTRFKVSFSSLASDAAHASAIRAWLFVPARLHGRQPAIIAVHQTIPQGKDEPAGIK